MGFKDLAFFIDALLAIQACRLLYNKDSLSYQVFKSKIFPNCSISEVLESNVGSYAWRSILKDRDVLLKGARWRGGNGETIRVWLDAWLPSHEHLRILTPMVVGFEEARVADLIDPSTRQWDSNMLQGLFAPNEAELIKSIPLCSSSMEDKMAWPYTSLG